jgi:hypothetical protein
MVKTVEPARVAAVDNLLRIGIPLSERPPGGYS